MKTFQQFQEDMSKLPGLGGGGGGTNAITDKAKGKTLKNRIKDVGKILTFPISRRNIKPDPTEKFATEGVAALALKGGSKLIPALVTGIGAAGTYLQSKKKDNDVNITPRGLKNLENAVFRGKTGRKLDGEILKRREQKDKMKGVIKPKEGEITKQRELLRKTEKDITKPKSGEKKKAKKVVDTFKKVRKKEGETMYKLKQDQDIATKGPGDLVPKARKTYLDKLLRNLRKEEVAIANSMSGGGIAGSVEAGDEPPVKKKKPPMLRRKTYAKGGTKSRKPWLDYLKNK